MSQNDNVELLKQLKQQYTEYFDSNADLKRYFLNSAVQKWQTKPEVMIITSIDSIFKIGRTSLQLVKLTFKTELGNMALAIAIKEFSSPEEAKKNHDLSKLLNKRLANHQTEDFFIATPQVICQRKNYLIYEGVAGHTFLESPRNYYEKLFVAGKAIATYHGAELRTVSIQRYDYLLTEVVNRLPIPYERKIKYKEFGVKFSQEMPNYNSGAAGFGDYHESNIMFSAPTDKLRIWLIDPEFVEQRKNSDRMEDITTFLLYIALNYYQRDANLLNFYNDIMTFFNGYNNYLQQSNISLDEIYSNKVMEAFMYHLGLNALLEALYGVKTGSADDMVLLDHITLCLGLANYCWKHIDDYGHSAVP